MLQAAAVADGPAGPELSAAQRTLADAAGCCSRRGTAVAELSAVPKDSGRCFKLLQSLEVQLLQSCQLPKGLWQLLQPAAVVEVQLLQSCQLPKGLWQMLQAAAVC